jgi:hypothetical protein
MATTQGLVSGATNTTNTTDPTAANVNSAGKPVDYTSVIQNLYKTNLNRDAETAGIDYYNKQLQSGRTLDDIKNEFVNSQEYKTLHDKQNAISGAKQYYATQVKVDPGQQTVQGQLAGLTDPNSQINARAIAQAQQDASKRGLINSSIAGSAAQAAVLDKALPVAQQDAQTYNNVALTNAAAENTASQFNASAQNQFDLQDKTANSQQALQNSTNASQQAIAQLNANTQLALGSLDAKTKTDLQNIVSKNSQLLQANTSAANATSQLMASIAQVQANDKLDAAAKQTAVNNLIAIMNESLATFNDISGAGLDLTKYFQQIPPAATAPKPDAVPDEAIQ